MVDLSQDQDQSAGPSTAAAKPFPTLGNDSRGVDSAGHGTEAKLKPRLEEEHGQSTGKKKSARPARGRQEVLQDAGAVDVAVGGQQLSRKVQRHSKSGVEVEMEEI